MDFVFFINSILLGLGLTMDAFSVSLANGLNERGMSGKKMAAVAGMFAFFQAVMPMIGWVLVHTMLEIFEGFEKFIPWIALALLAFIGIKMIIDGVKSKEESDKKVVGFWGLVLQGIATSIDALSVGFTIASHNLLMATIAVLIIGVITFVACLLGVMIGKKFGTKISNKATILGGILLILIGLEIFITSFF
jgi:putative Mn2+ efflux pump MntP